MSDAVLNEKKAELLRVLANQGIEDANVLDAIGRVPREEFVPQELVDQAYDNHALAIGMGQTISQPYIVGIMTQSLKLTGNERVLEIGTGSGYQAAILSLLGKEVYTIERIAELAHQARERLRRLGYQNIHFGVGDGSVGWPEHAPFDAIIVTAAAPHLPQTLMDQLAEGGRFIAPVGDADKQTLYLFKRQNGEIFKRRLCECRFVPLIGADGFEEKA